LSFEASCMFCAWQKTLICELSNFSAFREHQGPPQEHSLTTYVAA
jgi:hypothetical protein